MNGIIGIPKPNRFFAPWEFVESLLLLRGYNIITTTGALIYKNRNDLMQIAKSLDADYLLMVDTDMVFKRQDVEVLEKHIEDGLDIVSGYCNKSSWENEGYKQIGEIQNGMMEVEAVGGAFVMISKKVIQVTKQPFSIIKINDDELSEDRSFCQKVRELGFKIYVDTNLKIGHIRQIVI